METKANYILVGAFTVAGFIGILLFAVWFAKVQFDRQFAHYDILFPDVTGLSVASDVRFAGLSVGKVIDMELSGNRDGTVRVRIEVSDDTPIRTDSVASLEPQGVTGVNNVSISAGNPASPLLREAKPEGVPVIRSSRSMLQTLSDQGPKMVERLGDAAEQLAELLGPDNQTRVRNILDNVERSSGNLDKALADVSAATGSISSAAEAIAGFGDQLSGLSDAAKATLGNADTALDAVTRTAGNADTLLEAGTETVTGIGDFVAGDLKTLTGHVGETARVVAEAVPGIAEQLSTSLGTLDGTLAAAERAFDGAATLIDTDLGPVLTDLRQTLGSFDTAVTAVSGDLPEITARLKSAAESADSAFASLRGMIDGMSAPVAAFARDGLPQINRTVVDLRSLIDNMNQLVSALRRNPAQLITGPRQPEFRR